MGKFYLTLFFYLIAFFACKPLVRVDMDSYMHNKEYYEGKRVVFTTDLENIVSKYEEAGLENVDIEKYSIDLFEVRRAEVSLVEYGPMMRLPNPLSQPTEFDHMVDFVLQGYSGSYDWVDFRDDLLISVIGNGSDPATYTQASGRACFIEYEEDGPGNPEIYRNAYDAGARAIVLQNLRSGEEIGYPPFFKSIAHKLNIKYYFCLY